VQEGLQVHFTIGSPQSHAIELMCRCVGFVWLFQMFADHLRYAVDELLILSFWRDECCRALLHGIWHSATAKRPSCCTALSLQTISTGKGMPVMMGKGL
jgi:hypothetical protein